MVPKEAIQVIWDVEYVGECGDFMQIRMGDGEVSSFPLRGLGEPGQRGCICFDGQLWRFDPYVDQTLTRWPEKDEKRGLMLGWRTQGRPYGFVAPCWMTPGMDGDYIPLLLQQATVEIPPEFTQLARELGSTPAEVLQQFVADAAQLMNFFNRPRADGLCSGGSDERRMALEYLERAWGGRTIIEGGQSA